MAPFSLESELGLPRTPAEIPPSAQRAPRWSPDPSDIAWTLAQMPESWAEGLASQICVGKDLRVEMFVDPSDVAIAHELATIAAEVALPYVSDAVDHSLKSDGSPVSACDLAVERALIGFLRHYRPNDGILSEELGEVALGERRWL